jgi:hypothetical protein
MTRHFPVIIISRFVEKRVMEELPPKTFRVWYFLPRVVRLSASSI